MGRFGILSLALFSLQALIGSGFAADADKKSEKEQELAVSAQAFFPASEIFGIKLVNGHSTDAVISLTNNERSPVTVNLVGGSLWTLDDEESKIVRNLTLSRYEAEIAAGQTRNLSYSIATDMHPQDLRLSLTSVISGGEGGIFTLPAFNGTVSVIEPETSIFDPQVLFLYFFLISCFAGVVYFFYTVWVVPYLPQKRRGGKSGDSSKKPTAKKDPPSQAADAAANAAATGPGDASATVYNAEWIPAHHINRPEARKVKGTARSAKNRV